MVDKILLVTAGYYPDSRGGAERQARILAEALGRCGVDVTLVAPSCWPEAPEVEPTGFGRVERLRVGAYPSAGGRHLTDTLAWTRWFLDRYRTRVGEDVPIYVFHARLHALGPALAATRAGAPLLIKLGGGGEASDFAALRAKRYLYGRWVQSYLLRRTDCFVANGAQIEADLALLGVPPSRIAGFPNGVMIPPADDVAAALRRRTGRRFIFTGRLVPDKRLGILCEAALSLADQPEPPEMTFLGVGPEQARLAAMAEKAIPGGNVTFPGFVEDVYPALLNADFFLSASTREGQSNALLEAMSAGLIPIVYAASGATDVVEHGVNGFLVERSEPADFVAAMRMALALTAQQRHAMATAARRFVEAHIGIDAIAKQTLAIIRATMQARQRAA